MQVWFLRAGQTSYWPTQMVDLGGVLGYSGSSRSPASARLRQVMPRCCSKMGQPWWFPGSSLQAGRPGSTHLTRQCAYRLYPRRSGFSAFEQGAKFSSIPAFRCAVRLGLKGLAFRRDRSAVCCRSFHDVENSQLFRKAPGWTRKTAESGSKRAS